jgi:hypothetical protein
MNLRLLRAIQQANPGDPNGGGGGGGGDKPWYGDFGADAEPEFKQFVTSKAYADPMTALRSHWNAEKLVGAPADQIVKLPKADDKAGWDGVWNKLGRPEKPDGYELPLPAGDDGSFGKTAANWFHQAGVPKQAAQSITKAWNEHINGVVAKQRQDAEAKATGELNALKTEWGNDFTKNEEFARRGLREYGKRAGLDDTDLGTLEYAIGTTKMLKLFKALGESTKEGDFHNDEGGNNNLGGTTPAAARTKIDEAREKRMKNEMSEADYQKIMDQYGPLAYKSA